jgi:hypothetical protein
MSSVFGRLKSALLPAGIIGLTAILTFVPGLSPVIYSDDWDYLIKRYLFHGFHLVNWASRRPLEELGFQALMNLFGLNIRGVYYADIAIIFCCAYLVYLLVERIFPRQPYLALPVALIFLIYPVDYTRMWLIQSYTWIIYLETLLAMYWLLDFAREGRAWPLLLALALFILPLGAYEAQMGILFAWCVVLAIQPGLPVRRRALLLLPLLIGGLFMVWRMVLQPALLQIHDPYVGQVTVNAGVLLARLKEIGPVFLESWVAPFQTFLGGSTRRLLLVLLGVMACAGGAALALGKETSGDTAPCLTWAEKKAQSWDLIKGLGLGLALLVGGYFPVLAVYAPNLNGINTRVNLFSIFGGSLALVSLVALAALWVADVRGRVGVVTLAAVAPLLLVGMTQQLWNENEARLAWYQQKHFWQEVFQVVPDLKDHTTVVLVIRGAEPPPRPFLRLPITAEWEFANGLQVLYNNTTLKGMLYYTDMDEGSSAHLERDGVRSYEHEFAPYEDTVFLSYDFAHGRVQLLRRLEHQTRLPFTPQRYHPKERIRPEPPQHAPYRGLVGN